MASSGKTNNRLAGLPLRLTRTATLGALVAVAAVAWAVVLASQRSRAPFLAHVHAAQQYVLEARGIQAEHEWLEAVRLDPRNPELWNALGEFYSSTGTWVKATMAFEELAQLLPGSPDVDSKVAACALAAGDEVRALKYAEAEISRNPNDVTSLAIAATLLAKSGEERRRLEYKRRLVQLEPNEPDFALLLAQELTDLNRYEEARPLLERLIRTNADAAQAYALRGVGFLNEDPSPAGLARAEADFRESCQLDPRAAFPRYNLGKLYMRRGEPAKAVHYLGQAASLLSSRPDIYYELAAALEKSGKPMLAAKARARFTLLRDEIDELGALEKRCSLPPPSFDLHLRAGLLSLKQGSLKEARFYLEKADTIRPGDPRVQTALRRVEALSEPALIQNADRYRAAALAVARASRNGF